MKNIKIHPFIYFLISILYLEIITKIVISKQILNIGLIYTIIFSIPLIILLTILTKIFNKTINKVLLYLLTLILTIYFEVQYIFYILFSVPFSFSTIGLANQALDFVSIIKDTIITHLPIFISILIPFILLLIISRKIDTTRYHKQTITSLIIMLIISYLSTFIFLIPNKNEDNSPYKLYYNIDDQSSIINNFGMLTYTKIDIKRMIFGYETELSNETLPEIKYEHEEAIKEYGNNILDLNLTESSSEEINRLNNYISNQVPTNKTEYTGMFKNKNLIFILAEGFNEIAVDETRTPTLYKLANNGFVFKNFYSPVFLSTTGGEFQATTGLIPTQPILKSWKDNQPTISFALGNAFSKLNYRVQSYHDWTYTYYKRNATMATLGFTNYTGCGNGLEQRMDCTWLPLDSEMVNVTTPDYLGKEGNFVTYYVSVSGHSPYAAGDNIAKLHLDSVSSLNYPDPVKYYLAAQVELDKMLENLLQKLEESGELKDTVIALVGDHYPYTLSTEEVNTAATYQKDGIIEINRSNFILWNSEIEEPIIVDKVGSQIDVLPTLLNLFGVDYDSRLIVGKDILSNAEGIAIFSNRSWVTDIGSYNSSSRTFTLKEGKELTDETQQEYISRINRRVANNFTISKLIIDNNYYQHILGS
ncbi:MAG TPA: hypothetical protein DCE23_01715 [Firmicutes bacterium]|nr:hypothetical protein [Bacillota bacterium]